MRAAEPAPGTLRNIWSSRGPSGKPLELVEQKGANILRIAGTEEAPVSSIRGTGNGGNRAVEGLTHAPDAEVEAGIAKPPESDQTNALRGLQGVGTAKQTGLPRSWDKFEPTGNAEFQARLEAFRGSNNLNPTFAGGEGRIFAADGKLTALKRWFNVRLGDMPASIGKLRQVKVDVEMHAKLKADVDVVRIHEQGPDWILRDFDPNSVELKAGPAEAQTARARAIAELQLYHPEAS